MPRSTASPSRSTIWATTVGGATFASVPPSGGHSWARRSNWPATPSAWNPRCSARYGSRSTTGTTSTCRRLLWCGSRKPSPRNWPATGAVPLARDLYDLQWFATAGKLDEALVRRLWVLKVYRDVVVDGRGGKPLDPQDVLRQRNHRRVPTRGYWLPDQAHPHRRVDRHGPCPLRVPRPTRRRRTPLGRVQRTTPTRGD